MNREADALAFAEGNKWSPIPRMARTTPFGYRLDEQDPDLLQPVPLELDALEKAKQHLTQFSLRDVARWLTEVTGRKITSEGLRKRVSSDDSRRRKAAVIRDWAERVKKAEKKLTRYEKGLGARVSSDQLTQLQLPLY